jgi:hypothetical protein
MPFAQSWCYRRQGTSTGQFETRLEHTTPPSASQVSRVRASG